LKESGDAYSIKRKKRVLSSLRRRWEKKGYWRGKAFIIPSSQKEEAKKRKRRGSHRACEEKEKKEEGINSIGQKAERAHFL